MLHTYYMFCTMFLLSCSIENRNMGKKFCFQHFDLQFSEAGPVNGAVPHSSLQQPSDGNRDTEKGKENEDDTTEVSRLLGSKQIHTHRCLKCGRQVSKESVMLLCNLVYPDIKEGMKLTFFMKAVLHHFSTPHSQLSCFLFIRCPVSFWTCFSTKFMPRTSDTSMV